MPAGHGLRSRCRDLISKGYRKNGVIPLTDLMRVFKIGDYVDIKINSAVHAGMPHKWYHGKTGVLWNVTKRSVGVEVNKQARPVLLARFSSPGVHLCNTDCTLMNSYIYGRQWPRCGCCCAPWLRMVQDKARAPAGERPDHKEALARACRACGAVSLPRRLPGTAHNPRGAQEGSQGLWQCVPHPLLPPLLRQPLACCQNVPPCACSCEAVLLEQHLNRVPRACRAAGQVRAAAAGEGPSRWLHA